MRKVKSCHFSIPSIARRSKQLKKQEGEQKKYRSDPLPLSPRHCCIYYQLRENVLELDWLLSDLFNTKAQKLAKGSKTGAVLKELTP